MKFKYAIEGVCLGAAALAIATDVMAEERNEYAIYQNSPKRLKQTIIQAISAFEQTAREDWSFRITRYENEEGDVASSIEQYDPALGDGNEWSLLRLNGEQPGETEQQAFARARHARLAEKGEHSYSVKLSEIIQTDSLVFHAEGTENVQATFRVHLSRLGDEATKNLIGTLSYNKQQSFIESIEIVNTETFSPMFSARITDFSLKFSFFKIDTAILPHQQRLNMKGSFAFFTTIDEASLDTFSDYQKRSK